MAEDKAQENPEGDIENIVGNPEDNSKKNIFQKLGKKKIILLIIVVLLIITLPIILYFSGFMGSSKKANADAKPETQTENTEKKDTHPQTDENHTTPEETSTEGGSDLKEQKVTKVGDQHETISDPTLEQNQANATPTFFDLDEFLVNLNSDSQPSFLKLRVTLQIAGSTGVEKIKEKMPLIRDGFQTYLRELKAEDLQGSAGLFRLREELLLRINKVTYPVRITDILFKDILVQ